MSSFSTLALFGIAGSVLVIGLVTRRRQVDTDKKPGGIGVNPAASPVLYDHGAGNVVPIKTTQPFTKISSYMFSPWNPLTNPNRIDFYDVDNMPRTDIIMPGGGRLVTYGGRLNNAVPNSQSSFHVCNAQSDKLVQTESPVHVHKTDKNLNHHSTLFHSRLNR